MILTGTCSTNSGFSSNLFCSDSSTTLLINSNTNKIEIDNVEFINTEKGNFIEIIKRQESVQQYWLHFYPAPKYRVWKEVYGVIRNDKGKKELNLIKTIEGVVTDGYYTEESVYFDE